tara:strand:- start:348 stop:620 length:273 start_codon:yes stop_codon:yes gene_type:complete
MKSLVDLKKEFKKRKLRLSHCQETVEDLNDFLTIDLLKHNNVDATLVALVSSTMNISSWYQKKSFVIDLLQSALATVESEKYKEDGNKLN